MPKKDCMYISDVYMKGTFIECLYITGRMLRNVFERLFTYSLASLFNTFDFLKYLFSYLYSIKDLCVILL